MNSRWRGAALPALAVVLVSGVLGVQWANGGGQFEPMRLPDSCAQRPAVSVSEGIGGLTEELVLRGVSNAACLLGTGREQLTLDLARGSRSPAQVDALKAGLLRAVEQMDQAGTLPPVSALLDEALDSTDLPGWVIAVIKRLPDGVVDGALSTDDVLTRALADLDLADILENLDQPENLTDLVVPAITQAVKDALEQRLRDLV